MAKRLVKKLSRGERISNNVEIEKKKNLWKFFPSKIDINIRLMARKYTPGSVPASPGNIKVNSEPNIHSNIYFPKSKKPINTAMNITVNSLQKNAALYSKFSGALTAYGKITPLIWPGITNSSCPILATWI